MDVEDEDKGEAVQDGGSLVGLGAVGLMVCAQKGRNKTGSGLMKNDKEKSVNACGCWSRL